MWYRATAKIEGLSDNFLNPIRTIIPEGLITDSNSSFWISAYFLAGIGVLNAPLIQPIGNGYIILFHGTFKYYYASFSPRNTSEENPNLIAALRHCHFEEFNAPSAPYLMLIFPCTAENMQEASFSEQMKSIAGLLGMFNGLNFLYEKVFENVVDFNARTAHLMTPSFPGMSQISINFSTEYLRKIQTADNQLNNLSPSEKIKFELALRWYGEAQRREDSTDSFIKLWVAIETISMPTTNIRALNEILKEIYSLNGPQTANQTYKTGRLQDIRSKILHNGIKANIKDTMLDYMEALFTDVLLYKLNLEPEYRLKAISERINIEQLLTSIVS